ncbi:MAG TPA: hypothetical protein VJ858_02945 [Acidimicrobiia bacterium]|nr:hypothetical protein [Acidimicrobiia bacterium]
MAVAIEESLARAEAALAADESLAGTGFWPAVSAVKRQPELVDRYADRIAAIDTDAHRRRAMLVVPLWLGTTLMILATVAATALVGWAYTLNGLTAVIVFYLGFGALLVTTHSLGHLLVGSILGIGFQYWFLGKPSFPLQGGVKIDYASYLRARAESRAWMHAAGAIVTKAMPFLLIGAALAAGLPTWAVVLLPIIGVGVIVLDAVWSTKMSDWKKYKREMAFAR